MPATRYISKPPIIVGMIWDGTNAADIDTWFGQVNPGATATDLGNGYLRVDGPTGIGSWYPYDIPTGALLRDQGGYLMDAASTLVEVPSTITDPAYQITEA